MFHFAEEIAEDAQDNGDDASHFEADAKLNVNVDRESLMNEDSVIQSATLFFGAGFDTTSNALAMACYFLAVNPEVQDKAREEVDSIAADIDDKELSYDDAARLEYVEMVFHETQRIMPTAAVLERSCSKDYTMSNGVFVPKGTRVQIPNIGFQHDANLWPDPEKFMPERHTPTERRKGIDQRPYLPFGTGPRNCIGMRFAILEIKVALYHLLKSFVLEPSSKTPIPLALDDTAIMTCIKDGTWIKLTPRENI